MNRLPGLRRVTYPSILPAVIALTRFFFFFFPSFFSFCFYQSSAVLPPQLPIFLLCVSVRLRLLYSF